jgi:peptidoglycan/xylan/chitin deacetylase (PgdA/CDA1 family)
VYGVEGQCRRIRAAASRTGLARWLAAAVCALLVIPSYASAASTVVSLTFDDGQQTQYHVRPILASHRMLATFYVNSGLVGRDAFFMPWSRLEALASDGNEVAGHSLNHPHLTQLTAVEQRREICGDRKNLLDHGFFPVASFAYPYAEYDAGVESTVQSCGYMSGRAVGAIRVGPGLDCRACPFAETIPPADPFATRTPNTLLRMQNSVTQAENNRGGWVQFVFHAICDGCDGTSVAELSAFLDWLQPRAANGTVVKTVADVMGAGRSGFTAPPPPDTLRRVRVLCHRSGPSGRRRITCAIRHSTPVVSVGARLKHGRRTLIVLRPHRGGRFTIGGFSRGLPAGRYRVVVVLRDRRGLRRVLRIGVRV